MIWHPHISKNRQKREAKASLFFAYVLIASTLFTPVAYCQEAFFPEVTGARDVYHSIFFDALPDSASRSLNFSFEHSPIYHEWSDSVNYHRYSRSEQFIRAQWNREKWLAGVEYYSTNYALNTRPVSYQSTGMALEQIHAGVFASRMFPALIRVGALLSFNTTSRMIDYRFNAGWERLPWFQPFLFYVHSSTSHATLFRLYDSAIRFDDTFVSEQYGLLVQFGQSFPLSYTFRYSLGELSQPHSITDIDESQRTTGRTRNIFGDFTIRIGKDLSLTHTLEYQQFKGHSNWYTSGAQFAYFNNIRWKELVWGAGIRWKNIRYKYSNESIKTGTYGQVTSNHPFSEQVIDLLGTTFAVDVDGNIEIETHKLTYLHNPGKNVEWECTAAYLRAQFNQADFSTYALVWGFPRWETLRVSSSNIKQAELLRLSLSGTFPVTSRLDITPFIRQYVPVRTRYEEGTAGGGPSKGKRKSFGGMLISLRLEFRY